MHLRSIITILLSCAVFTDVSFAQDSEPEGGSTLKQRYLEALTKPLNYNDINFIGHDLLGSGQFENKVSADLSSVIVSLRNDDLHLDPDIQKALIHIRDYHPVTNVRLSASKTIPPVKPMSTFAMYGKDGGKTVVPVNSIVFFKEINKTRHYCSAESVGAKSVATVPEALLDDLTPIYDFGIESQDFNDKKVENVDIFAKDVSGGWLTGYGGVPGLGLHYVPRDKSRETQYLLAGTIHAIMEKEDSESFLVVSNDVRQGFQGSSCPSSLKVSEVTETGAGKFKINVLKIFPNRIQKVSQLKNGDMFLSFGTGCFFFASDGIPQDKYYFNPPIGLTPSGLIYDVCEKDTTMKRW